MTNPVARWTASAIVFLLVVATSLLGFWSLADAKLADVRFAAADRAPSGDIVFVDIDARTLSQVGLWPWPRSMHGQLLDKLMDLGVYEVAFDIDFSAASTLDQDAAFAASLERAGGYAYLGSFHQADASGALVVNRPLPAFAENAQSVLVNVNMLESGLVRTIPARASEPSAASIAVTFSPDAAALETIRIDYGIDLQRIVRIPAVDILNGNVDPALMRDRQVVVGVSAIELHDLFDVPRYGIIPGAMVQVAAAETVKLGRSLTNLGAWPALSLLALLALGLTVFHRSSLPKVVVSLVGVSIAVELLSIVLMQTQRLEFVTMPLHVGCVAMVVLRLLEERVVRHRQLREHRARLAYLANHDIRTGAMSRTAWIDAIDALTNSGATSWIVLVRLDRLDAAGASLGFEIVEAAIAVAHARLARLAPGMVARIESDIFTATWRRQPEQSEIEALLATLEQPYDIGGHRLSLETRWGASGEVSSDLGASQGLQQARMALSAATASDLKGARYDHRFEAELQHRQRVDTGLRQAAANGELEVVFQSQVDMLTRQTIGVEALLRWNSPDLGPVSPADFIPMAEENGTIVDLGRWVLEEACRQATEQDWQGRLSVNVSPVQFQLDDVVGMVRDVLDRTGFPANRLDIEITESLLADNGNHVLQAIQALRAMGARIAIDDFGTGYSSLSHLSTLPVDKLKIDQSFVRQMADPRGFGVLETIIALGQRLELEIVVEGVETEAEFGRLATLGCHVAQGFLFGRPGALSAGELTAAA